ncbi:gliding motility-associated C-terminal domain-containing protein [Myroides sp. LJL115]
MKIERVFSGLVLLTVSLLAISSFAQETNSNVFSNSGVFYISPGTEVGVESDFFNEAVKPGDMFINNGSIHFFNDFENLGIFDFDSSLKLGKVSFAKTGDRQLILGGVNPTSFNEVYFNSDSGISVQNALSVASKAYFVNGILYVHPNEGSLTFLENSSHEGARDEAHVSGKVEKEGKFFFEMPVGDSQYYRGMALGESGTSKDIYTVQYVRENPVNASRPFDAKEDEQIDIINDKEYWEIDTSAVDGRVIVSLSWNEATTPREIIARGGENKLRIMWWDEVLDKWVNESGVSDVQTKTVTTTTEVRAKGIFTLGVASEKETDTDTDVIIYNGVSPNGDGINDYFTIKNISKYPNNSVEVINRWGNTVFSTTNYDKNGDGSENVFTGMAEGRGVRSSGKLPSGTYFYVVKYEFTDANGTRWIKKAGYLNLENN